VNIKKKIGSSRN